MNPTKPSLRPRRGFGRAELIVVGGIVAAAGLLLILAMPGRRENARLLACQRNLGQIGLAVRVYTQATRGRLPTVPADLGRPPSPLGAMLERLGDSDFSALRPDRPPTVLGDGTPAVERRIGGFICPSDPNATAGLFPAPVSYRANAGDDPEGLNGPFAPGRSIRLEEIEAADGSAYTAAFCERLVGDGRQAPALWNYARVSGPVAASGGPDPAPDAWRGDAGSTWISASWVSTLYNHTQTPGSGVSLVADDGRSARMGASSGHAGRVHVLLLDGSVRPYLTQTDLRIWKALGNTHDAPPSVPGPVEVEPASR
jgi:prepilin-type processing-associated H-X9-DG protein